MLSTKQVFNDPRLRDKDTLKEWATLCLTQNTSTHHALPRHSFNIIQATYPFWLVRYSSLTAMSLPFVLLWLPLHFIEFHPSLTSNVTMFMILFHHYVADWPGTAQLCYIMSKIHYFWSHHLGLELVKELLNIFFLFLTGKITLSEHNKIQPLAFVITWPVQMCRRWRSNWASGRTYIDFIFPPSESL